MDHFHYRRHFLLLTCCCVLIAAASRLHLAGNIPVSFASYGAMHASTLAIALRARQSFWRSCLFIVIAAVLSVATLYIALMGKHVFEPASGSVARYTLLGLSAGMGAMTYGLLIRWCGLYALSLGALAVISAGCVLSAFVALFTANHFRFLGLWWIAALWWYGFSGGLWYFDQRHRV